MSFHHIKTPELVAGPFDINLGMKTFQNLVRAIGKHGLADDQQNYRKSQKPACRLRLDMLEADMQHRLRCMKENGGLCIRDENNRRRK
jgi:hypothetical protein